MIRDGLDEPPVLSVMDQEARDEGWLPICLAPIGRLDIVIPAGGYCRFDTTPMIVEGLTTHGNVVRARYHATGDYRDRWTNDRGNVIYALTHFRLLHRPAQRGAADSA